MIENDYPHLIRESYYLNEQAQEKLNENNHTMKTHLEEKLKALRGNLQLMESLYVDPETPHSLMADLFGHMVKRVEEIKVTQKLIDKADIKIIPVNNIFHEAIQFDIEGRYPNSTNA